MAKSIKAGVLYRDLQVERSAINETDRTAELSFSSELPANRWFGVEILDHSPESIRTDRLRSGAALLWNHNSDQQIGVVEKATISPDRRGRALVRFGESSRAEEIWKDVKSGVIRLVSVGYRIHKMVTEKVENGVETMRATDWEPLEISLVSVPVDHTVGVGRGETNQPNEIEIIPMNRSLHLDADPAIKPASGGAPSTPAVSVDIPAERQKWEKEERDRVREINAIADRIKTDSVRSLAKQALESGMKLDEFRGKVLEQEYNAKPVQTSAELGMEKSDLSRYRITNAIRSMCTGKALEGVEKEAHEAVMKQYRMSPKSPLEFYVPFDVQREQVAAKIAHAQRALEVGSFTSGGALVDTTLLTGSFIELLRNSMYVMAMGARSLTGLVGDIAIPRQTGGATAYWLSESGTITASQQAVGQLELKPHRLGVATAYTQQLLAQSSLDIENFVRTDIAQVIALEKDDVAINGTGVNGEPLGIVNTTGVNLVTIAGAQSMTYANSVSFETALAIDNALAGNLGFLTTPTVRNNARILPRFSNTDTPVWQGGLVGDVTGYPARATNQCPTGTGSVIFGRWDDLILADWAGMSILVDPYSLSLQGQVRIVVQTLTDCGIRHAESFALGTT